LARASSALALASAALEADEELLALEPELPEPELLDEDDEPDEPELEEVDAEVDAVDELESPELSVAVCDAVSHAATKNATAASAIRRCNMVMLPVLI
jgi:hypothetical protein